MLLAILVFNWVGYRILSDFLQHRSNISLEAKLDLNDYAASDLIELKVQLNLPYLTNWKDFQRCDGEIVLNNVHYKYVKRKITDGNLILLCLPNVNNTRIEKVKEDYFKTIHDLPSSTADATGTAKPTTQKNIISDYLLEQDVYTFSPSDQVPVGHYLNNTLLIDMYSRNACEQPPGISLLNEPQAKADGGSTLNSSCARIALKHTITPKAVI